MGDGDVYVGRSWGDLARLPSHPSWEEDPVSQSLYLRQPGLRRRTCKASPRLGCEAVRWTYSRPERVALWPHRPMQHPLLALALLSDPSVRFFACISVPRLSALSRFPLGDSLGVCRTRAPIPVRGLSLWECRPGLMTGVAVQASDTMKARGFLTRGRATLTPCRAELRAATGDEVQPPTCR